MLLPPGATDGRTGKVSQAVGRSIPRVVVRQRKWPRTISEGGGIRAMRNSAAALVDAGATLRAYESPHRRLAESRYQLPLRFDDNVVAEHVRRTGGQEAKRTPRCWQISQRVLGPTKSSFLRWRLASKRIQQLAMQLLLL